MVQQLDPQVTGTVQELVLSGQELRYAALGDSFTEGLWDEVTGHLLGWSDRVALALAALRPGPVRYANLALRGAKIREVAGEQLEAAVALDPPPTLVTFCGGGNDLLHWRFRPEQVLRRSAEVIRRCRAVGALPVLVTPADPSRGLPLGEVVASRGDVLANAHRDLAAREGIPFVDISHDSTLRLTRYWAADRLHLNALGHQRVAETVLAVIAGTPDPAPPGQESDPARGPVADLHYYRTHLLPWIGRRLRGRSSGYGRAAKYPGWVSVP